MHEPIKCGRKPKFSAGDRVKGKEEGPASFGNRVGAVLNLELGPGQSEYAVTFDDTKQIEHVLSSWFERLD